LRYRKAKIAAVILLLLALLCVVVLTVGQWEVRWASYDNGQEEAQSPPPDPGAAARNAVQPPIQDSVQPGVQDSVQPRDNSTPASQEAVSRRDDSPAAVPRIESMSRVTVRAVDTGKIPVPHLQFEYAFVPAADGHRIPQTGMKQARFDARGKWSDHGRQVEVLWIRVLEPGWSCALPGRDAGGLGRIGLSSSQEPNTWAVRLVRGVQVVELVLLRNSHVGLHIEYADGVPYAGPINIAHFTGDGDLFPGIQTVEYAAGMTVTVIESRQTRVSIRSDRGGFKQHTSATIDADAANLGLLRIIIERDPNRLEPGGLILDHSSFAPGQQMVARLLSNGGPTGAVMILHGPGETRSDHFPPTLRINCVAVGQDTVWTSGIFKLKPGEWRRLTVEPVQTSRLSLVVQDESGAPIPGAVVSAEEVGQADWSSLGLFRVDEFHAEGDLPTARNFIFFKIRMTRVRADDEGRVLFRTGWPGKRRYFVEAVGHESELIEVDQKPGQHTDFGVVTLQKATARVTVKTILPEGQTGADYQVNLSIPFAGSGTARPVRLDANGEATIPEVPANRYYVFVMRYPQGGFGWSRLIELERGGQAEVTIDLTRDHGLQED
jgi:hypothetical protein